MRKCFVGLLEVRHALAQLMPLMQYARPSVCDVASRLVPPGTEIDMINHVYLLGDAVLTRSGTRPVRQLVESVFGTGSAAVHIILRRLTYAFALDASRRRPDRQELVDEAVRYALSSREARQRSCSGIHLFTVAYSIMLQSVKVTTE